MKELDHASKDEMSLIGMLRILWSGKWFILITAIISLILVTYYQNNKSLPKFKSTTKIETISTYEVDKYMLFNSTGIFEVGKDSLFELYVESLKEITLFDDGITNFNLLNINNFDNVAQFRKAVEKFLSDIEIIYDKRSVTLSGSYNDVEKWKQLITFINDETNKKVRKILLNRFDKIKSSHKQKLNYELEDLETKIENAIKDYDRVTNDRLAFLTEQAAIARNLGIQKNTFESQYTISILTSVSSDEKKDSKKEQEFSNIENSYYLRGYENIEEEIRIINSRNNKTAFIKDLRELEKAKRSLEQDKSLERAEILIESTPLAKEEEFIAAKFNENLIKFNFPRQYGILIPILAFLMGAIVGSSLLIIINALSKLNISR